MINKDEVLSKLSGWLPSPGMILTINDQSKGHAANDVRDHIAGTFEIQLRHGIEALEIQRVLLSMV
jgi:hypothetical protein